MRSGFAIRLTPLLPTNWAQQEHRMHSPIARAWFSLRGQIGSSSHECHIPELNQCLTSRARMRRTPIAIVTRDVVEFASCVSSRYGRIRRRRVHVFSVPFASPGGCRASRFREASRERDPQIEGITVISSRLNAVSEPYSAFCFLLRRYSSSHRQASGPTGSRPSRSSP